MDIQELISRWNVQSTEELAAKASDHLPFWVSLGLVILISYYLARLMWMFVPADSGLAWSPPAMTGGRDGAAVTGADYSAVVNAHLFGQADREAEPVTDDAIDAPDTRLNLTLRATIADRRNDIAHAIIADGSGREEVYFIRDSIPGGATLHQVHPDRVILNRGGVLEALRLPRVSKGDPSAGPRPVARATRTQPANRAPTVQEFVSQNAANFTQIIRPQPYMPGGQLKGYRVYPGRQRQQFTALGLRPGDLVTEINGTTLDNPAQGMAIFRSLGNSSQISITIERNGETQSLTLDTSQLEGSAGATR